MFFGYDVDHLAIDLHETENWNEGTGSSNYIGLQKGKNSILIMMVFLRNTGLMGICSGKFACLDTEQRKHSDTAFFLSLSVFHGA